MGGSMKQLQQIIIARGPVEVNNNYNLSRSSSDVSFIYGLASYDPDPSILDHNH